MLSVNLICIGKIKEKYIIDGISEFTKRLKTDIIFNTIELKEIGDDKNRENSIDKESNDIYEVISKYKRAYNILLDIEGQKYNSELFSKKIEIIMLDGYSTINFIIGGSYGVNNFIKKEVDLKLSFSDFTFPHQLMRLLFIEQLYRWVSIMNNGKYHK